MPVTASDIVAYAAANKPTDDTSTNGGAIDATERVVFTDLAADDTIEVVSDNAGDTTQDITVTARNAAGETVSQTVTLNGTTPVELTTMGDVQRIQRALLDSDAAGVVTVRRHGDVGDVGDIPAGERGFRRMFIDAVSNPSATKDYYEKIFFKNNNATLSLLNAVISESADPTAQLTFLLAASKDDSATSTNRVTAPAVGDTLDPDTFDGNNKSVPGTNLAAGEAIGVWVELALTTDNAPIESTYTLQCAGSTT
jgi:hypothetical protein